MWGIVWKILTDNWKIVAMIGAVLIVVFSIWNYGRTQFNAGKAECREEQARAQAEHVAKVTKTFSRIDHAKPSHNDDSGVATRLLNRAVRQ